MIALTLATDPFEATADATSPGTPQVLPPSQAAAPGGAEAFARAYDRMGSGGAPVAGEGEDPRTAVRREVERWRNHFADLDAAAEALLAAMRGGALHHAWLITGPPGIGKATFARAVAARLGSTRLIDNTLITGSGST